MWSVRLSCLVLALSAPALAQQRECECVEYWLCSEGKVVVDGTDLLDIRTKSCPGIQVCCLVDDEDNPSQPPVPTPSPTPPPVTTPNLSPLQPPNVSSGGGCGRARFPANAPTDFKVTGINGHPETTFYGEAPWMVVILQKQINFKCGGTLITPSVVLTAAHCVMDIPISELSVRAGEYDNRIPRKPIPPQTLRASRVITHPKYNSANLHNDIALIVLDGSVQTNAVIDVICAPQDGMEVIASGCVVTGWGRNASEGKYQHVLSKINLDLRDRDYCINLLRTSRLGTRFRLHEGFICAGGGDNRDTCKGDGGGPLVCPTKGDPNKMVQMGVVSWGIGCGEGFPTVLTSVKYYLPWIQSQIS